MYSKNAHVEIIYQIASGMKKAGFNKNYLELGISKGACYNRVAHLFDHGVGVDIKFDNFNPDCKLKPKSEFFAGTTDSYFAYNDEKKKFNLIFIDANHHYEYVERDFKNSLKVLDEDGIILLHDTYAPTSEYAKHCEDAWKVEQLIDLTIPKLNHVNLPFYYGITIVQKYTIKEWWKK